MYAACFVLLLTSVIPAAAEGSGYICGDADGSGEVSILDATAIQRTLAGLSVPRFDERAADVDGSGMDILDATKIQRYLAGFSDAAHIGEFVSTATHSSQDQYELPLV